MVMVRVVIVKANGDNDTATTTRETLSNGLRVVTEEVPNVRSVTLGVWVGCGAKHENKNNAGISHFLEHMFFKGTKRRTAKEIATDIESVGGILNAGTDKEYTVFYSVVLSEHLYRSIDLLSDMLFHSTFHPGEMEKEKSVVLEEIKMYEDSPDEQVHDFFIEDYLKGASLGRSILGTKKTIDRMKRSDLTNYVKKHYVPSNMIIAAAGQLNHEDVVSLVSRAFGAKNGASRIRFSQASSEVVRPNPQVVVHQKETEQVHFCLGGPGLPQGHKDRYVLSVLDTILGSGMSSRLFQTIREKEGLTYSISSFIPSFRQCGLFGIYAGTSREHLLRTVRLICRELKSLREKGVTKKELVRAKEQMKGNILLNLESMSNRMTKLARAEFYLSRDVPMDEIVKNIESVTLKDILRVARAVFIPKKLSFAALGPLDEKIRRKLEIIIRN